MLLLTDLLKHAKVEAARVVYKIDESWLQGRALYGGLSAALCLDGALKLMPDLPPLRSANINFIGLGDNTVWVEATLLRRGKSVAFVSVKLMCATGLITDAVLSFGEARESALDVSFASSLYGDKTNFISPEESFPLFFEDMPEKFAKHRPAFTHHFDARMACGGIPFSNAKESDIEVWVKHIDPHANNLVALVAMADMLPPAIVPMFKKPAPISSMTWMFNLLTDDLPNENAWWLMGAFTEHAQQGYSSQNMTMHDRAGNLVLVGRQNVTLFY